MDDIISRFVQNPILILLGAFLLIWVFYGLFCLVDIIKYIRGYYGGGIE